MNCDSHFIASQSSFARSRSPASIASIARSIVGRDISASSSSENHRSLTSHLPVRGGGPYSRALADLDRLVVAAGEPVATALHGGEELLEVDLEGGEDLVGVVLGAEADLALGLARVLDDLLGGALGLLVDLLARRSGAPAGRGPP